VKKKLKLEGKNMLNKEQLKEIKGGDYGCSYNACFCETGTGSVVFIGCLGQIDCRNQCSYIFPPWGV
jgi:hypothetical protein